MMEFTKEEVVLFQKRYDEEKQELLEAEKERAEREKIRRQKIEKERRYARWKKDIEKAELNAETGRLLVYGCLAILVLGIVAVLADWLEWTSGRNVCIGLICLLAFCEFAGLSVLAGCEC